MRILTDNDILKLDQPKVNAAVIPKVLTDVDIMKFDKVKTPATPTPKILTDDDIVRMSERGVTTKPIIPTGTYIPTEEKGVSLFQAEPGKLEKIPIEKTRIGTEETKQPLFDEKPVTPLLERITKGYGMGVAGMVRGGVGALKWYATAMGMSKEDIEKLDEKDLLKSLDRQATRLEEFYKVKDPDFTYQLAAGVGSLSTFFIPGLGISKGVQMASFAPRLAAWLGVGASSVMESIIEAGSSYNRAVEKGMNEKEASGAATKTFWLNLPTIAITNKFGLFGEGGNVVSKFLKSGSGEGVQEFTQQLFGNFATKDPLFQGALQSGAIGFLTGGGMGLVTGIAENIDARNQLKQSKEIIERVKAEKPPTKIIQEATKPKEEVPTAMVEKPAVEIERRKLIEELSPAELAEKTVTDKLTGLHNREWLSNEYEKTLRGMRNSFKAVASADLVNFKSINEKYGHGTGDYYLKTIADAFKTTGLEVSRTGGDEFTITGNSVEELNTKMENLTNDLKNAIIRVERTGEVIKQPGTEVILHGTASAEETGGDFWKALDLADSRYYDRKVSRADVSKRGIPREIEKPSPGGEAYYRVEEVAPKIPTKIPAEEAITKEVKPTVIPTKEVKPITKPEVKPSVPKGTEGLAYPSEALASKIWQVEMPKEPITKERINKTEIMNWAEKEFKVPIRGKATFKMKDLAGIYQQKPEIVRLRKWGELEPLTHEIAHHIDKKMKQSLGNQWRKQFIPMGERKAILKELGDLDYAPNKRRTSEGFAEYIRHLTTTDDAGKLAPKFHKFFTETFLNDNPDIKNKLNGLRKRLAIWQKQGAENRVLEQIDFKGEHVKADRGIYANIERARGWVIKNFVDEFYYPQKIVKEIEKIRGEPLKPSENPSELMTFYKSKAGAIAKTFVTEKAINIKGEVVGPGLQEILKPIPIKDMNSFTAYAVAKRAILKQGQGKETGIDMADAQFIVDKYKNPVWNKAIDDVTKWNDNLMQWIIDAGGLGKEEAIIIREMNPIYLPFKRAFIEELAVVKGTGGFVNRGQAIKAMKGSAKPILNPWETMIGQATEMIAKAQKIHIAKLFADLAETEGVGGFITKVPPPTQAMPITVKTVEKQLNDLGIDTSDANMDDVLTVFTQGGQYKGKDNIVSIWRNGKREFYEIHPDLYRALTGLDFIDRSPLIKIMAPFARLLRLGATGLKASFFIKNLWRDAFTYSVLSKKGITANPFDSLVGIYKSVQATPTKNPLIWKYEAMGGRLSGMIGMDRAATMSAYDELLQSKLQGAGKLLKIVKHPIQTLQEIISIPELGPRSAELESRYNQYRKEHPDWSDNDAFIKAFNDAQDVTVNFTKSGNWAKRINEVSAFFKIAITGPEKLYRSFRENPIGLITRGLLWLTLPMVVNWFKNKDKDWYKNLPPAYKYNNFWFEVGNNVYRLPIPFDLGTVFCSAPLAALDVISTKDPKYIGGLLENIKKQIPDPTPSVLGPVIDVMRNKDFLGRPIETEGMQHMPSEERKREYTTKLASVLSKGFNSLKMQISPLQIDYLINNYTGGFSRQIPLKIPKELPDWPVIGEFMVKMPERPAKQISEFYLLHETLQAKKQAGTATQEELKRLYPLRILNQEMSYMNKRIRQLQEQKKNELIKQEYVRMQKRLGHYGFK